jgi:hypothetical protein
MTVLLSLKVIEERPSGRRFGLQALPASPDLYGGVQLERSPLGV